MSQWKNIVKLLFGLALLSALFFNISINDVLSILTKSSLPSYLLAAFLLIPYCAIKAYRWKLLLSRTGVTVPWKRFSAAYLQGLFMGAATPARLGEFGKAWLIKDYCKDKKQGFISILLDRLCDVAILAILVVVGWAYTTPSMALPVLYMTIAGLAASYALFRFSKHLTPLIPASIQDRLSSLTEGRQWIDRKTIMVALGLTLVSQVLWTTIGMVLLDSMNVGVDFIDLLWCMSVVSLLSGVSLTFLGVGVREVSFAALFVYIQGSAIDGTAFGLLITSLWLLLALVGGMFFFFDKASDQQGQ